MSVVFMDIDTQVDFIMPNGALYVAGAEKLLPIFEEISTLALHKGIPVWASADAHHVNDPEFNQFPPHCLKGTPGQKKVPQTLPRLFFSETNNAKAVAAENLKRGHILFEKQTFDVFSNPKIDRYLKALKPEKIIVYGVATDYCVKAAVLGLLKRKKNVVLLTDAIKAVNPKAEADILKDLRRKGVLLTRFEKLSL